MLLREFLYVDADKVRGILAQLDEGVIEGSTETRQDEKRTTGGLKGLAEHYQRWGTERAVQKSQGDALFPTLEQSLESLGLLRDLSDELQDEAFWAPSTLQAEAPPGTLVRITATGALFDARYVSATLSAFATTYQGLEGIGAFDSLEASSNQKNRKPQQRSQSRKVHQEPAPSNLEDAIPNVDLRFPDSGEISAEFLRGVTRISRGVFTPGLHLNLRPTGGDTHTVTARLQEGRQFLDSDADILFARYGSGLQEWTLVGTVGHHGEIVDSDVMDDGELVDSAGNVNRSRFALYVNGLMSFMGTLGFVDLPQAPGFSIVPLAVYRVSGRTNRAALGE